MLGKRYHVNQHLAKIVAQLVKELLNALNVPRHMLPIMDQRRLFVDCFGELSQGAHFSLGFGEKAVTLKHLLVQLLFLSGELIIRHIFHIIKARVLPLLSLGKAHEIFLQRSRTANLAAARAPSSNRRLSLAAGDRPVRHLRLLGGTDAPLAWRVVLFRRGRGKVGEVQRAL